MNGYDLCKPFLFALPAETAHRITHRLLRSVQHTPVEDRLRHRYAVDDDRLRTEAFGLEFDSPVGVAAGFDKNAELPSVLTALGYVVGSSVLLSLSTLLLAVGLAWGVLRRLRD